MKSCILKFNKSGKESNGYDFSGASLSPKAILKRYHDSTDFLMFLKVQPQSICCDL